MSGQAENDEDRVIDLVDRLPTTEEYLRLRHAVGWRLVDEDAARRALDGSLCGVCAVRGDRMAGMARLVGDGSLYFYIQDVVVDPAWQGQGLGRRMVELLEDLVVPQASPGAHVLLIAAADVVGFYSRLGYERLPDNAWGKRIGSE